MAALGLTTKVWTSPCRLRDSKDLERRARTICVRILRTNVINATSRSDICETYVLAGNSGTIAHTTLERLQLIFCPLRAVCDTTVLTVGLRLREGWQI